MKKNLILMIVTVLFIGGSSASAKNLWAYLTYATFNSPEGPYVETYLSIAGNSVKWIKQADGKYIATVNVLMTFKDKNDIKAFKKYELKSNEVTDTANLNFQFIDQQRFQLANGTYNFQIQLTDKNKTAPALPYNQTMIIDFPTDKPSMSGVEMIQSFSKAEKVTALSKSGYNLVPNIYNFYNGVDAKLGFYTELYGLDKAIAQGQMFLLSYYIECFENNLKLNEFAKSKKEAPKPVNVLLADINIKDLATGNYNLVVEARNSSNEVLLSKKVFFQRTNPNATYTLTQIASTDIQGTFAEKFKYADSLKEFISSTYPISTGYEKDFIMYQLKKADLQTLQKYFFSFWQQRSSSEPEKAWQAYNAQVNIAQANFATKIKKGYQTDRGRVYLQYGPPNAREGHYAEPNTYPYEIWQYYTLNNSQRNKRFVFYSPDMVTADFILLHSDAIGEQYEPRWKVALRNKMNAPVDISETQVVSVWGDYSEDAWDLPTSNL
ncbi:MAG: GWxTD domain-containing protein [Bacteroidetes bacterium]|nr:GWxTD domain-containing protein [Bacteroidota bacterium]